MKRIILLSVLICASLSLMGQTMTDRFASYNEMTGKEVWFYNIDLMRDAFGDFIYKTDASGKFKKVSSSTIYDNLSTGDVKVGQVFKDNGCNYLQVTISGTKYYLLIDSNTNFLMNARSASYWKQLKTEASKYKYISADSYILRDYTQRHPVQDYISITWRTLQRPASIDYDVYFTFTTSNNTTKTLNFKAKDFTFFKKDFVIVVPASSKTSPDSPDIPASTSEANGEKVSTMDSYRVFDADLAWNSSISSYLDTNEYIPNETLPFTVYGYSNGYYYGYLLGYDCLFPESYVTLSYHDAQYLQSRGKSGMEVRKVWAQTYDRIHSAEYLEKNSAYQEGLRLKQEADRKKSRELLQYLRNHRVILGSHHVSRSYGDYTLQIDIWNWYSKRIKYVDLTLMALNNVRDPRWNDRSLSTTNRRCIGYIESYEKATYNFEDVFYDYNGLIGDVVVCGAVITFEDNSTITISSQAAANMYSENHNLKFPDNFFYYINEN